MPKLTVHEASKINTGIVKREAVVRTFMEDALLRNIPFMEVNGDTYTYNVETTLPEIGFRGYNEDFKSSVGVVSPETEVLKLIGTNIDIDARLELNRPGNRAMQEQMSTRSLARKVTSTIINGDTTTDPRGVDGLKIRLGGASAIPANLGAPAANSPLSLGALMKARDDVLNPTAFIMSPDMARAVSQAAQKNLGGTIQIEKDMFGYRTTIFDGLPIWIVDSDNAGQRIIDFNEAGPAGGVASTSVYIVSTGPAGVMGLQNGGIMIDDMGKISGTATERTRIEWQIGLALHHERAAKRIWGITNAPVTA